MPETGGRQLWTAVLAVGFMGGMLVHEMLMEALFRLPAAPKSLALWTSVAEFGFCALIPILIQAGSAVLSSSHQPVKDMEAAQPAPPSLLTPAGVTELARSWAPFFALSLLVFVGTTASTQSARYVDYSVKVVFKTSKLLPTMVNATLMGNSRSFSKLEYAAAVFLCIGTAAFSRGDDAGKRAVAPDPNLLFGVLCLLCSVSMDALSPNVQQHMMKNGVCPNVLMSRTNAIGASMAILGVFMVGGGSQLGEYAKQVPIVLACLAGVGVTLSFSVICQVHLIKEAGSVVTVGVSTLRKSGTLLLSYIIFPGKEFGAFRAAGLVLVAAGLMMAEWKTIVKGLTKQPGELPPPAATGAAAASGNGYVVVNSADRVVGRRTSSIDDDSSDEEDEEQEARVPKSAVGVLQNTISELDRILDKEEEQEEVVNEAASEPVLAAGVLQNTIDELDRMGLEEQSDEK